MHTEKKKLDFMPPLQLELITWYSSDHAALDPVQGGRMSW